MSGDFSRDQFLSSGLYQALLMQQGRVALDADWNAYVMAQQTRMQQQVVDLLGPAAGPKDTAGFALVADKQVGLQIGNGHYYVAGILCDNPAVIAWAAQPFMPAGSALPDTAGQYTAYLDLWPRTVNAWQDSSLGEVALNGADTVVGWQQLWQVKLLPQNAAPPWAAPSSPLMNVQVTNSAGLGNWLYRIEIHYPTGSASAATGSFKWSRKNGAVTFGIQSWSGGTVTLAPTATALDVQLAIGNWVEFVDDDTVFGLVSAPLWQVAAIDPARNSITVTSTTGMAPVIDASRHPMLRLWDQGGSTSPTLIDGTIPIVPDTWIPLEDGIAVQFPTAMPQPPFATGDFWDFTSRTVTGAIGWPADANGTPVAQPKKGIWHNYAQLAQLSLTSGAWTVQTDLRTLFTPLAGGGANAQLTARLEGIEKRLADAEKKLKGR